MTVSVFITLIIGIVGVALLIGYLYDKARTEGLMKAARILGFQFDKRSNLDVIPNHANFNLFGQGRSKKIKNRMYGRTGGDEAMVFGYSYRVGGGQHSSTRRQTVTCLKNRRPLPKFELRPEHVFHKIGSALGYQDMDFESHPEFSSNQLLRGENEQMIRTLFSRRILDFFERNPSYSVESSGSHVLIYLDRKRANPDEIADFLRECQRIHRVLDP